jgi:hypothetical protein
VVGRCTEGVLLLRRLGRVLLLVVLLVLVRLVALALVVTSLFYLGNARLLVLMPRLYLYYRLAYSHLPDLPRT